jgi:hypothetical protein
MKLSQVVQSPGQWYLALNMAGGDVNRALSLVAIGWHETNMGRTPGYGQEGYELGVGAWGGGQESFRGLATQYEWSLGRLAGYPSAMSEADCVNYGQNVQKPAAGGEAWGRSVYAIRRDLIVDLPTLQVTPPGAVADAYAKAPPWAQYATVALLLLAGMLTLGGRE